MTICASLFILSITALAFIWMQPQLLRTLAARIMARAESIEAQRSAHADSLRYWNHKLRVDEIPAPSDAGTAGRNV